MFVCYMFIKILKNMLFKFEKNKQLRFVENLGIHLRHLKVYEVQSDVSQLLSKK